MAQDSVDPELAARLQELGREGNTMGSKSSDADLTEIIVQNSQDVQVILAQQGGQNRLRKRDFLFFAAAALPSAYLLRSYS